MYVPDPRWYLYRFYLSNGKVKLILMVVINEKKGGSERWQMIDTCRLWAVVINVLFSFYFPLTSTNPNRPMIHWLE
jgi:hypothetical protein